MCEQLQKEKKKGTGLGDVTVLEGELNEVFGEYTDPTDLPCNWNKIKFGDTVEIPLYGLLDDGAQTPLAFTDFKLKVRTPCEAPDGGEGMELCADEERYVLGVAKLDDDEILPVTGLSTYKIIINSDTNTSRKSIKDILLLWSIEDGSCGGVQCFLSNMTNIVNNGDVLKKQKPSLITSARVNDGKNTGGGYEALDKSSYGLKNGDIKEITAVLVDPDPDPDPTKSKTPFLKNSDSPDAYLKLHFVRPAEDISNENENVPYLEYQFLYKADLNISPQDLLVISEGYSGGFKQTLQAKYNPITGLVNYVIQQ